MFLLFKIFLKLFNVTKKELKIGDYLFTIGEFVVF